MTEEAKKKIDDIYDPLDRKGMLSIFHSSFPEDRMKRLHQVVLIVSAILGSWLGMQAVHESGHVIAAWLSGGRVNRVVLYPLTISRTDLVKNPHPLLVVWAGPLGGCLLPLLAWVIIALFRQPWAYLPRFFAGFCLIANGAYIAVGAFDRIGDAGEMLRHGSPLWSLLAFGIAATPVGLGLWHRQGSHFGLGPARGTVNPIAAYSCFAVLLALIALGLIVDGE